MFATRKAYTWQGLADAREKGNQGQGENKKGDNQWKPYSRQSMQPDPTIRQNKQIASHKTMLSAQLVYAYQESKRLVVLHNALTLHINP